MNLWVVYRLSRSNNPNDPNSDALMSELYPSIAQCAVVATALKILLFPA